MDAVIEPERLAQISLRQENPRMRMNAAPGSLPDDIHESMISAMSDPRTSFRAEPFFDVGVFATAAFVEERMSKLMRDQVCCKLSLYPEFMFWRTMPVFQKSAFQAR